MGFVFKVRGRRARVEEKCYFGVRFLSGMKVHLGEEANQRVCPLKTNQDPHEPYHWIHLARECIPFLRAAQPFPIKASPAEVSLLNELLRHR